MRRDAAGRERQDWIDLARAACILAVVLGHELIFFGSTPWSVGAPGVQFWREVEQAMRPFRMPLFFFLSGVLAAPSLGRARAEAFRNRIWNPFYLYALWVMIFWLLVPEWPRLDRAQMSLVGHLAHAATGASPLWYLWALPVAFNLGWVTRSLPPWIPIGVALLVALWPAEHVYSANLLRCLLFYLLGLRLPDLVRVAAARADLRAIGLATGALVVLLQWLELPASPFGLLLDLAAVAAAVTAASTLAGISASALALGRAIGRRTLPIYILHYPIMAALEHVTPWVIAKPMLGSAVLGWSFPVLMTAAAVLLSLGCDNLLRRIGLGWLFALPAWLGHRGSAGALALAGRGVGLSREVSNRLPDRN